MCSWHCHPLSEAFGVELPHCYVAGLKIYRCRGFCFEGCRIPRAGGIGINCHLLGDISLAEVGFIVEILLMNKGGEQNAGNQRRSDQIVFS